MNYIKNIPFTAAFLTENFFGNPFTAWFTLSVARIETLEAKVAALEAK